MDLYCRLTSIRYNITFIDGNEATGLAEVMWPQEGA